MERMREEVNRLWGILAPLFSIPAAFVALFLLTIAMAAGTFIENDFATTDARALIYNSWWFEVLLVYIGMTLLINLFRHRYISKGKLSLFILHFSILIILIGAGITRYIGHEGLIHIREGQKLNHFYSDDNYLTFTVRKQQKILSESYKVLFSSIKKNRFNKIIIPDKNISPLEVELLRFIPSAKKELIPAESGVPIIELIYAGENGRESTFLKYGSLAQINHLTFYFSDLSIEGAVQLFIENSVVKMNSPYRGEQLTMASQTRDSFSRKTIISLAPRTLYTINSSSFVLANYHQKANIAIRKNTGENAKESLDALLLKFEYQGQEVQKDIWGTAGSIPKRETISIGDLQVTVEYGPRKIKLPFALHLDDFILDNYPGSNSPSNYSSHVTLHTDGHPTKSEIISMNKVLNYTGYRIFQASYDKDEKGSVLSINHDIWGTMVSYFGYFLLALGMTWSLFNNRTRFRKLSNKLKQGISIIILFLWIPVSTTLDAQHVSDPIISKSQAKIFSTLLTQDINGRIQPIHTFNRECLRKISGTSSLENANPDQIMLSLIAFPMEWQDVPLIKIPKNENLKDILESYANTMSYNDFFNKNGSYKLQSYVTIAFQKEASSRTKDDKAIIKVDERVNVLHSILTGKLPKLFPDPESEDQPWLPILNSLKQSNFAKQFSQTYTSTFEKAIASNNWEEVEDLLKNLKEYQRKEARKRIPSEFIIQTELIYSKLQIFSKVALLYLFGGLLTLVFVFIKIFSLSRKSYRIKLGRILILSGFILHTAGLILRWIIGGHAPWSNAYESMVYIAWAIVLASLIFASKQKLTFGTSALLSSIFLFVAGMQWMDPQITYLVPVLKSYWLNIHVSLITASYGFFALPAVSSVFSLILFTIQTKNTSPKIIHVFKNTAIINEMSITIGLYMLSVGTFLGGIWANESWGRYWGWDPKETWALITILVYAFILHMRLIPGLRGVLGFHISSIVGFGSVMMTYFGVNYYLSGLHSYASGDPIPIPDWLFILVLVLLILIISAVTKNKFYSRIQA